MLKNKVLVGVLCMGLMGVASFVFADTTAPVTTVNCIKSAVGVRETAIGTALTTYTGALSYAYSTRATALQNAYSLTTGDKAIKSAVKLSWSNFTTFVKSAKSVWSKEKTSAWATFRTNAKACKASSSISAEPSSSSSEI